MSNDNQTDQTLPSCGCTDGEQCNGDCFYPGSQYQRLYDAIDSTNGITTQGEMDEIISIVHSDFPFNYKMEPIIRAANINQHIVDMVEKIRIQSQVYIWAFPITYRDKDNVIEKITFGWELEWPSGKTSGYIKECSTYYEALNEGIKAYQ